MIQKLFREGLEFGPPVPDRRELTLENVQRVRTLLLLCIPTFPLSVGTPPKVLLYEGKDVEFVVSSHFCLSMYTEGMASISCSRFHSV